MPLGRGAFIQVRQTPPHPTPRPDVMEGKPSLTATTPGAVPQSDVSRPPLRVDRGGALWSAGLLYVAWVVSMSRPAPPALRLIWILWIAGPAFVIAGLFLANWLKRAELRTFGHHVSRRLRRRACRAMTARIGNAVATKPAVAGSGATASVVTLASAANGTLKRSWVALPLFGSWSYPS